MEEKKDARVSGKEGGGGKDSRKKSMKKGKHEVS